MLNVEASHLLVEKDVVFRFVFSETEFEAKQRNCKQAERRYE